MGRPTGQPEHAPGRSRAELRQLREVLDDVAGAGELRGELFALDLKGLGEQLGPGPVLGCLAPLPRMDLEQLGARPGREVHTQLRLVPPAEGLQAGGEELGELGIDLGHEREQGRHSGEIAPGPLGLPELLGLLGAAELLGPVQAPELGELDSAAHRQPHGREGPRGPAIRSELAREVQHQRRGHRPGVRGQDIGPSWRFLVEQIDHRVNDADAPGILAATYPQIPAVNSR